MDAKLRNRLVGASREATKALGTLKNQIQRIIDDADEHGQSEISDLALAVMRDLEDGALPDDLDALWTNIRRAGER